MSTGYINKRIVFTGLTIYILVCLGFWFYKFEMSYLCDIVPKSLDYTISSASEFDEVEGWNIVDESSMILQSSNKDPKIFIEIPSVEKIYIDIYVNNLGCNSNPITSTNAEIYYASDTSFTALQRVSFVIKKGHNIVQIPVNYSNKNLRIDLTDKKNIDINIRYLNIVDYFKIEWFFKWNLLAVLLTILIICVLYITKTNENVGAKFFYLFKPLREFSRRFGEYINKNSRVVAMTFLFALLSYGLLCAYYTIYIDEERQIIETYAETGWMAQGRWGNYLFERFFLTGTIYTSCLGDIFASIFLGISVLINIFNFFEISQKRIQRHTQIVFCGLCMSVPYVCGAYMIVGIYNIEISLGFVLVAIANYFVLVCNESFGMRIAYASFWLMLSISIYQAFTSVFATSVVLGLLLRAYFSSEKLPYKHFLVSIFESMLVFIISVTLYYLINKCCFLLTGSTSEYLSNSFIGWGKGKTVLTIILEILENIKLVTIGSSKILYGGLIYRVSFGALGIWVILKIFSPRQNKAMLLFLTLCSLLMPFSLNFVLGNTQFAGRTLLALPSLLGVIWVILIEEFQNRRIICSIAQIVAVYLIFLQIQYINQFFLADFKRYQEDQIITQQIITDIRNVCNGYTQMPIIPVGTYWHDDNDLTMSYELAGSYYTVDGGSITRIIRFMQAQGYNVDMPTTEQIVDSYQYIKGMTSWPEDGSIKCINGYVIVKLSDPSNYWIQNYILPYQ